MYETLEEGDVAPDFMLRGDDFKDTTLSDYKGQVVVLYFYPKDDTPGCTQQAKDFTENASRFKSNNTVVIGMSKDGPENHEKFKKKHDLSIKLLSDTELIVMPAYGVWVEKNMYGKKYWGVERSTFIIDADGKIFKIWRKVKVSGHVEDVLEEVRKMS